MFCEESLILLSFSASFSYVSSSRTSFSSSRRANCSALASDTSDGPFKVTFSFGIGMVANLLLINPSISLQRDKVKFDRAYIDTKGYATADKGYLDPNTNDPKSMRAFVNSKLAESKNPLFDWQLAYLIHTRACWPLIEN